MNLRVGLAACILATAACVPGRTPGPDVEGIVRVPFPDDDWAHLGAAERRVLLRHLCCSDAWRVTRFGERPGGRGTVVACARRPRDGGYETTLHGYVMEEGDDYRQTRVMVRFSPYKKGTIDGWMRGGRCDVVRPGGAADVRLFRSGGYEGALSSYVVVEGEGVWVELFEDSRQRERVSTVAAYADICREVKAVRASATARERGFDPALLPPGSYRQGAPPTLEVRDGMQPGIYMVSGYVNPGEEGNVYCRVVHAQSGEEVLLEAERARTVEYVGWSDDPGETFFFEGEAMCKVGDWEHEYPARFELWFEPAAGGAHRLLMTAERRIFGWQR